MIQKNLKEAIYNTAGMFDSPIEDWENKSESFFDILANEINKKIKQKIAETNEQDIDFLRYLVSARKQKNNSIDKFFLSKQSYIAGKTLKRQWCKNSKAIRKTTLNALLYYVNFPATSWNFYHENTIFETTEICSASGVYEAYFVDSTDRNLIHKTIIEIKPDYKVVSKLQNREGLLRVQNGFIHIHLFSDFSFGGHLFGRIGGNKTDSIQRIFCIFTGFNRNEKIVSFPEVLIRSDKKFVELQECKIQKNTDAYFELCRKYKGIGDFLSEYSNSTICMQYNVNDKFTKH